MQSHKGSHLLLDLGTIFGWLELDRSIRSRKVFVYIGLVVEKLGRPNGCKSRDPIQLDGYSNRFRKSANYIPRYQPMLSSTSLDSLPMAMQTRRSPYPQVSPLRLSQHSTLSASAQ